MNNITRSLYALREHCVRHVTYVFLFVP